MTTSLMTWANPDGRRRVPAALAAILAATGLLVAGCSGSDSGSNSQASAAASAPAGDAAAEGGAAQKAAVPNVADQKLARNGSLSLEVGDIGEAVAKVRTINTSAGGVILSENIGSYAAGEAEDGVNPDTYAALSISVPTEKLDSTLDELEKVGKVLDRRTATENVTAEYVDTQARVESMKRSVARLEELIGQTKDIDELVNLERELSSRQSDLEAVEARLQQLERETSRSPITINLTTEPKLVEGLTNPKEGFVGGLQAGWKAFVASLVGLLTILGALLPFILFGALVGWPLWLLVRKWRRSRPAKPVAPQPVWRPANPAPSPAGGMPTPWAGQGAHPVAPVGPKPDADSGAGTDEETSG
ncbi:putative lipoprotein [Nostocoides australiense Ben110]|uniref:Putative lipoprotein n=1 Tax=Nostocoides australiense Ben110 TaxID=1193182 RepID=W6K060_9MICO|nr:DUF4349 domain-containing protein [Tetrasphaera australiensis]CCH74862.1 putative lipoprotein [Tetrasphaera australiensis Ben110]